MGLPLWLSILKHVGPPLLLLTPAGPALPYVLLGIESAEKLRAAHGAEKLAHAKAVALDAVRATNAATGSTAVDPDVLDRTFNDAASTVVDVVNLIHARSAGGQS